MSNSKSKKLGKISAVIAAAGMGKRLGVSVPKAFIPLDAQPLFTYSLKIFDQHKSIYSTVCVFPKSMVEKAKEIIRGCKTLKPIKIVPGGNERWKSVRNGVLATEASSEWVMVHDAARPFVTTKVIDSVMKKRSIYKCVITAIPIDDTVRRFKNNTCTGTVERSSLIRVGTPQLFHRQSLLDAFDHAESISPPPTDEAMLMEKCGISVGFSWGDPMNFKITTESDLEIAKTIVAKKTSLKI